MLLILAVTFLTNCSKDETGSNPEDLLGKWIATNNALDLTKNK